MASAAVPRALTAAQQLAQVMADAVGVEMRSVILHGSLSAGGFRPRRSDIDLLAVVEGGLTDVQAAAVERLVRRADAGSAAGIDLDVVTADVADRPTRVPTLELHLSRQDWPSVDVEADRHVTSAPDLLAELSIARAHGSALVGAAPHEVIAPVPTDWIVERGRYWLKTWRSRTDDSRHAAFMVLTTCRIWRFAMEQVHCPKAEAARWALDRDTSLLVVRQALHQYQDDSAVVIDKHGIAGLLDVVLHETSRTR